MSRCRRVLAPRVVARLCIAVSLCVALLAGSASGEVIDRVLAVAGGEVILLSDVRAAGSLGLIDVGGAADPTAAILARLIDRTLVIAEVNRYAPPEPEPQAVDDEVRIVRERFATAQAYLAALADCGLDEPLLRERVRQNLRIRAYLDQRFGADTPERAEAAIAAWVASLRRRAEIVNLYVPVIAP
jgi:hypothetical protein